MPELANTTLPKLLRPFGRGIWGVERISPVEGGSKILCGYWR